MSILKPEQARTAALLTPLAFKCSPHSLGTQGEGAFWLQGAGPHPRVPHVRASLAPGPRDAAAGGAASPWRPQLVTLSSAPSWVPESLPRTWVCPFTLDKFQRRKLQEKEKMECLEVKNKKA